MMFIIRNKTESYCGLWVVNGTVLRVVVKLDTVPVAELTALRAKKSTHFLGWAMGEWLLHAKEVTNASGRIHNNIRGRRHLKTEATYSSILFPLLHTPERHTKAVLYQSTMTNWTPLITSEWIACPAKYQCLLPSVRHFSYFICLWRQAFSSIDP